MVALGSTLIDTAKFGSNDVTAFYLGSNEAWTAGEPAELIKPTGIANTGGSATLGTNGQVTFSGVTSLSLNGCFTADFDNYVVIARGKWDGVSGSANTWLRLRASGTDASGTQYTDQYIEVNGTSIGKERLTSQTQFFTGRFSNSYNTGQHMSLYGPYLAQPTAYRSVVVAQEGPKIRDDAGTHSLSTSYDGLTFLTNSATGLTGSISVYGLRM